MRTLDAGDRAVLIEFDDLDTVLAYFRALDGSRPDGVSELVPAARTVLVRFDPGTIARDRVIGWIRSTEPDGAGTAPEDTPEVTIAVRYDGPDLAEVGEVTGLGVDGVIEAHTREPWTVAFGGFAPGFAYLTGGDTRLHVPRRDRPRTAVPVGSVALAGEFSGIYPHSSPGGWQLVGTTEDLVWDPSRQPAALLRPGVVVRFRSI